MTDIAMYGVSWLSEDLKGAHDEDEVGSVCKLSMWFTNSLCSGLPHWCTL